MWGFTLATYKPCDEGRAKVTFGCNQNFYFCVSDGPLISIGIGKCAAHTRDGTDNSVQRVSWRAA